MDETRKKEKLSPAKKMLIASLLLISAALIQHLIFDIIGVEARQDLIMTDTGIGIDYGFNVQASFYSPGGRNFFYAARDGMQNMSSAGELRWQSSFNLSLPVMVGNGEMVAVGEANGHRVYVFNNDGPLYIANLEHPLIYFTVNRSGFLSVIMQTDSGYLIQVFNPGSPDDPRFGLRHPMNDANVFPFSVDVSDCGTYIAKAFLDVNTLLLSRLTFGYFRRAESRGMPEGLIASNSFPDEFIYRVRFTNDGRLLVLTDKRILGFAVGDGTRELLWTVPLHNRPELLHFGESHFAFVTGEPFLNQSEAVSPGILHIYDFNGQLTGSYDLGRRATHLTMGFNTVLVGTGRSFFAINVSGTRLWTYSAIKDVQDILFLDNSDTILLAGGTRASVMRRLR